MSAPSHDCDRHRQELLLGEATVVSGGCEACGAWDERRRQVTGLLSSLERLPAPADLDARLAEALDLGAAGQEPLLRGLERRPAPADLDAIVAADLAAAVGDATGGALAALERRPVPTVLDRLVDEELRDPAAVTRRFSRSLFRFEGPRSLADRIDRDLREAPVRRPRLALSLGGLAAAALLAVGLLPLLERSKARSQPLELSFEVVEVGDLERLDPFARSLVDGLAGGKVNVVRPTTDTGPGPVTDGGGR